MSNIARKLDTLQVHQDGEYKMNKDELQSYVRNLINSYARYGENGYRLDINNLFQFEQLIFLSKLCDPAEYAYHMCGERRKQAGIEYYKPQMQKLIDKQMPFVWAEIQDSIDDWKVKNSLGYYGEEGRNEIATHPDGSTMSYAAHRHYYGD